ncbi:MAG: pantoate--beta-alanine ligase [Rhodospirillaceae bacterium]|nr:pantoate--beta-alanine ligase [Rhodospirillaceae bacterium]
MTGLPIARTVADLRAHVRGWRAEGLTVGLVPTMGALHAGHLSLVDRSTAANDRTVVTIFVNPKQFGPTEDLARYPRREAEDVAAIARQGAHLVFAPTTAEMYPDGHCTTVTVAGLTERLEGAHRPGHFDGVTTVVAKLLLQALADRAYFGEKDYQQLMVITRLAHDLDIPTGIVGVATVREPDGLALSSRNEYLTPAERAAAPALNRSLRAAADAIAAGAPIRQVEADAKAAILAAGFASIDYVACCGAEDLMPLERLDRPGRILTAARLGTTRLIDNVAVPFDPKTLP